MNPLLSRMLASADPSQVAGLSRFFKTGPGQYGEGDKFLGIKVPVTRAVVKECWREVSFEELEECIASEYHEVRLAALLALVEIFKHSKIFARGASTSSPGGGVFQTAAGNYFLSGFPKNQFPSVCPPPRYSEGPKEPSLRAMAPTGGKYIRQACIEFYLSHLDRINNWDLVDLSCYPLLGEWLLSSSDRSLLYSLARDGRTIWEQRIGIVSTMTFVRHGQLNDTFAIADILLHHPHDLIHKAVGWLLREAGKRDKDALVAYLLPRYQTMPRTMLRYAIEKLPEAERQKYLQKIIYSILLKSSGREVD